MKSKIIKMIGLVLIFTTAIAGTTFALLTTQSNEKTNQFVPGVLTAPIFENGVKAPDDTNILPPTGTSVVKKVQVQNAPNPHEVDAYIRVMFVPTFRTNEGTLAGNMSLDPGNGNTVTVTGPKGGTVTLHLASDWKSKWIFDNGYFYCKAIVAPGGLTTELLQSVVVSDIDLWNSFQLEVLSDAVQSENGAAADAWGSTIAGQLNQP